VVPPAFSALSPLPQGEARGESELKLALTGEPGFLQPKVLRNLLTLQKRFPKMGDGGDFIVWPAASHRPAAL